MARVGMARVGVAQVSVKCTAMIVNLVTSYSADRAGGSVVAALT